LTALKLADDALLVGTADDNLHYYSLRDDDLNWTLEAVGGLRDVYLGRP
jgi:hypothetical protein